MLRRRTAARSGGAGRLQREHFGLAVAIGAGVVGVAGAVNVTIAHVTTLAYVDKEATVNTLGSVAVAAVDYAKTLTIGGGVAGGFVGVGGGVDVGILYETVEAYTQVGSEVIASGNVGVYGLGYKEVTTFAIGLAGGFVGVAGGVSVWTIGPQATSTYNEGAGGPDKGEWQPARPTTRVTSSRTAAALDARRRRTPPRKTIRTRR